MQKRCVNHMSLRPLRRLFCFFDLLISWKLPSALSPPTYHHTINKRAHRHPLGCIRFLHFWFNLLISKGHNKPETLNSWRRKKTRKGKPFSGWLWSYYVWGSIFVICWGIRNMTKSYHRAGHTRALNYSQLGALVCFCKVVKARFFFPPLNSWQFTASHPNLFGALQP